MQKRRNGIIFCIVDDKLEVKQTVKKCKSEEMPKRRRQFSRQSRDAQRMRAARIRGQAERGGGTASEVDDVEGGFDVIGGGEIDLSIAIYYL